MLRKILLGLIGIYIFWLCLLPILVSNAVELLCKNFSHNSQYEIQVNKPQVKFSIFPVGAVSAKEIIFKPKNDSFEAKVEDFKLSVRLLPLFSGKFHINNLSVNKIAVSATLADDLVLDKEFFNVLNTAPIKIDSIKIGKFEALLYQKGFEKPIEYKGKDFNYQRKNRYIKLQNNSTLNVAGNISKVTSNLYLPKDNDINKTIFDIEISKVNIEPLRDYFRYYLPNDLLELRGEVSVNASKTGLVTELSNCAILMKDSAKSIIFPDKMFIKSKFNINRKYINFENIDIESKNIHAFIDGKILDYFGKTMPTLDLKIRLNKSKVEDIVKILPAFKVEEIDVYKLKKYKMYGEALANFRIKGRLPEPDVIGDVYIEDVVLTKPIPNTSSGATIKLNFSGKHANFDVTVPAGNLEKVWVKGSQELYNIKYADLVVKSSENVNLKYAQDVLNPLHEVLNFIMGPVPILDIHGKGNIDISVKGNRKNPHVWGVFNIKNGMVSFIEAPNLIAKDIEAVLKFNDQSAVFETIRSTLNEKDFKLSGTCDLFGRFDFDLVSENQPTEKLYNAIKTSKMFSEVQKALPDVDAIKGLTDLKLKIYGDVKNINNIKINENVFANGDVLLRDNNISFQNILVEQINAKIKLQANNIDSDLSASIGGMPLTSKVKIKNDFADLDINIPKLNPNSLIADIETRKKQYLPYLSVVGKYKGNIKNIQYDKLNIKSVILGSTPTSKINYSPNGTLNIMNNKLVVKNIKGFIANNQNTFDASISINDAFGGKPDANGYIRFKVPDIKLLNEIIESDILPKKVKEVIEDYQFNNGVLNLDLRVINNRVNAFTDLAGMSFIYKPLNLPVDIVNGSVAIKNNTLRFNKINLLADDMPVLVNGDIKDLCDRQKFDLYFNSKPKQEFIDKYINKNQIYPIKIKGDIVYWLRLKGTPEDYDLKAQIDMSKDSSFYHFGATIGDIENAIVVYLDTRVIDKNIHKIREFSYDKKIESQSGRQTRLNMLKAWGGVEILKEDLGFDNLRIKTSHPTDARIFNIIFRKPNIKQGQFSSDLRINGKLSDAKVIGDFHIFETNIPFLDTTMKNIELVFKDKFIEFASKGEIMGNDIVFEGVLKNKLTVPYRIEKAYLYTKDLDLNRIINKIKIAEVDAVSSFDSLEGFDINSIVTKDFIFKADNIKLRNIHATNFEALTSLSEKSVFDVEKFKFNIAQGELQGKFSYNLKNNDMGINLLANNISANDITWALFDLNNQIYGDLTGDVKLTCNGLDFNHCMETLSGNTKFNVKNGKMPKLGSLEYLLKAGNLVKGGLTGISINSVIDLLAPARTGDFSDISGYARIKDGIARNVEITTQGDDLNLFIGGTYNFATSIADMEVLGQLSRKISTILGPIGNVSINTLFNVIPGVDLSKDSLILERINKIPGLELSSKAFRKFIAEIKGNINGDDYVTSFKWIN